jgi:phosphomannomutase
MNPMIEFLRQAEAQFLSTRLGIRGRSGCCRPSRSKKALAALRDNGRVVLRYSGTERLARVMVEAEHEADVQRFTQ